MPVPELAEITDPLEENGEITVLRIILIIIRLNIQPINKFELYPTMLFPTNEAKTAHQSLVSVYFQIVLYYD